MKNTVIYKAISASLAALLLCLAMGGCTPADGGKEDATMETYDFHVDTHPYEDALGSERLLLANKEHPLGASYAPASLDVLHAGLTLYGKSIQLESAAAKAVELLIRELHLSGYDHIYVTSGYRDYAYQRSLFHTYVEEEREKHPAWTQAQLEAEVLTYSAKPGTSEHQTGLCVDLISDQNVVLDESFADDPAYAWLCDNAHYFGFILRYPKGKTDITGYAYEPWHYRFVGVEAATAIHAEGLTLEEYLAGK